MEAMSLFCNSIEPTKKRRAVNTQLNKLIIEREKITARGLKAVEQ